MESNSGGNRGGGCPPPAQFKYTSNIPMAAMLSQSGRAPGEKGGAAAGAAKQNNDDNDRNDNDRDNDRGNGTPGKSEETEDGTSDDANNDSTTSTQGVSKSGPRRSQRLKRKAEEREERLQEAIDARMIRTAKIAHAVFGERLKKAFEDEARVKMVWGEEAKVFGKKGSKVFGEES